MSYLRLCFVTHIGKTPLSQYKKILLPALRGGITSLQYREKIKNVSQALEVKNILDPFKIPLIINDHVDIAKAIDADGVHLGQSDFSPIEARKMLGPNKIIGWSIESLEDLEKANQLDCLNYVAASAVFPSITKPNCKTIWKIPGLQKIVELSKYPVIGIGGINLDNIENVMNTGAHGAAVIGAIQRNNNPQKATTELLTKINHSIKEETLCLRRPKK